MFGKFYKVDLSINGYTAIYCAVKGLSKFPTEAVGLPHAVGLAKIERYKDIIMHAGQAAYSWRIVMEA
jgi:hypothetical protein